MEIYPFSVEIFRENWGFKVSQHIQDIRNNKGKRKFSIVVSYVYVMVGEISIDNILVVLHFYSISCMNAT